MNNLYQFKSFEEKLDFFSEYKSQIVKHVNLDERKIKVGFAIMEKKIKGPSKVLWDGLSKFDEFEIVHISEEIIFSKRPEEWPICDTLISFFSDGLPFTKILRYVELRNPYMINDLYYQRLLWDRRVVYAMCHIHGIPTPPHITNMIGDEELVRNDFVTYGTADQFAKKCQDEIYGKKFQELLEKGTKTDLPPYNPRPEFLEAFEREEGEEEEDENEDGIDVLEENKEEVPAPIERSTSAISAVHRSSAIFDKRELNTSISAVMNKLVRCDSIASKMIPMGSPLKSKPVKRKTTQNLAEHEEYIVINGYKLVRPFVEKPINAEDHNINVYYPFSTGGGCKTLFRKTDELSSKFYEKQNEVRNDRSYIYETFLPTRGFDVKVYTVGPLYAYAEARKSPTLDGVVERLNGKEVRYPVIMTKEEKEIAQKIVLAFKAKICGFDLLRSGGKSYVCDVNGWSFVKGNDNYYHDCVIEIRRFIIEKLCPKRFISLPPPTITRHFNESQRLFVRPTTNGKAKKKDELRSVVAIFRHADRTPKQKMKMIVIEKEFLRFFKYAKRSEKGKIKEVKLKTPKQLKKLLEITKRLLESQEAEESDHEMDRIGKFMQLKNVLERGGGFEGINRKVQMKPITVKKRMKDGKPIEFITEALFILKWGGELTHAGYEQAMGLGDHFRTGIFPTEGDRGLLRLHSTYRHDLKAYSSDEGRCLTTAAAFIKGLLALHGPYAPILVNMVQSDEVALRMLDTSEEAGKELSMVKIVLDKLVHSEDLLTGYRELLEEEPDDIIREVLEKIESPEHILEEIKELIKLVTEDIKKLVSPTVRTDSYLILSNPKVNEGSVIELNQLPNSHIMSSVKEIAFCLLKEEEKEKICGCGNENILLMFKRWKKLEKDFYSHKKKKYDVSKIPDIYDCIKYDILHNPALITEEMKKLMDKVGILNGLLSPFEYGFTDQQKMTIGIKILHNLLEKIRRDILWWDTPKKTEEEEEKAKESKEDYVRLDTMKSSIHGSKIKSPWRHVRTRLYFTSASHMYTLFNILKLGIGSYLLDLGDEKEVNELKNIISLDYLSYIIFKLYEDFSYDTGDRKRFRLELCVSPGCNGDPLSTPKTDHTLPVAPLIAINKKLTLDEVEHFFQQLANLNEIDLRKEANMKDTGDMTPDLMKKAYFDHDVAFPTGPPL